MSERDKNKPMLAVDSNQIVFTALLVALREARATGVLTDTAFDFISKRAEEIAHAMAGGKMVVVSKSGAVEIRDLGEDDWAEIDKRPEDFPMARTAKKTLDV